MLFRRTGGQHGTGEIGRQMGPVSGFVLEAEGEPRLYIAGDTIWCSEVDEALARFCPDVVVANAGAASFLVGGPITMPEEDILSLCLALSGDTVVAVHMGAINHCSLTRAALRERVHREGLAERVRIPEDGELLSFDYHPLGSMQEGKPFP